MARGKIGDHKIDCPICGKPTELAFKPFCSSRCKQLDLHKWLSESYRIPDAGKSAGDDGDDAPDDRAGPKNQSESED